MTFGTGSKAQRLRLDGGTPPRIVCAPMYREGRQDLPMFART